MYCPFVSWWAVHVRIWVCQSISLSDCLFLGIQFVCKSFFISMSVSQSGFFTWLAFLPFVVFFAVDQSAYFSSLSVSHLIRLFVCLPVFPSVCLSVRLSVCLSFRLSVRLSLYLSVWLSVCLSVFLCGCPSVCLSFILTVSRDKLVHSNWLLAQAAIGKIFFAISKIFLDHLRRILDHN